MFKKLPRIMIVVLSVVMLVGGILPSVGYAQDGSINNEIDSESTKSTVLTLDDSMTVSEQNSMINDYLSDPNVEELIVLDESLLIENNDTENETTPTPRAIINQYKVNNVRGGSDVTGSSGIATAIGEVGILLNIGQTKSVATTVSADFGASNAALSGALGYSVTGSTSITISGQYRVPSKVNGKKVKTCKMTAYPVYKTKLYDVHKMPWNAFSWTKMGTGKAKKAYGVSYKKVYTYK
ncbi:hypothetical protein ABE28_009275 [Peribacillus muralis]|uniref:Uncharacterized protein n=1 Tax=Peribacillus muralis TaxID=264697 RepID=A0A1B3XMU0_9BACI|nr:hypothetical protein [Peribacillus muralis]AOH54539.1 hypothetical protein ABE28_009275 [Peribacillus muralis]